MSLSLVDCRLADMKVTHSNGRQPGGGRQGRREDRQAGEERGFYWHQQKGGRRSYQEVLGLEVPGTQRGEASREEASGGIRRVIRRHQEASGEASGGIRRGIRRHQEASLCLSRRPGRLSRGRWCRLEFRPRGVWLGCNGIGSRSYR